MTSIYRRALGADFARLHPRLQERFGFSSADHVAWHGEGVMEEVWRGRGFTVPFLWIGSFRNILVTGRGRNVPFQVRNYAYVDAFGRETVTWNRVFRLRGRLRRFDATMIYSQERRGIVDYLGTHQHLAVDLHLSVQEDGGLRIRSGEQRFHEGPLSFRFPTALSGAADIREGFDDAAGRFQIDVTVVNPRFGRLFGYRGTFTGGLRACPPDEVPAEARPRREERRE